MSPASVRPPADFVIRGGHIHILDGDDTTVDALAGSGGEIIALGEDAACALIGPRTRMIELDGRTAIPGVNDAHLHGAWLGARWPRLFFGDEAASHHATGPLVDNEQERRTALRRTWRLLSSLGITSYTEPGIGPGEDEGETGCFGTAMLETYLALHREKAQTSRVTLLRLFGAIDGESTLEAFERGIQEPTPDTDERWLAIPGVKIFADGIPPLGTAWVRDPYPDGSFGSVLTRGGASPEDALRRMITLANARGLQVAAHATGDRAIDEFVTVVEQIGAGGRRPHYVVHGDLISDDLIIRMRAAGMGVAIQPLIAAHSSEWASSQLGDERARRAWPLATMLASGMLTTITSDAPIATPDWRASLDAARALLPGDDDRDRRRDLIRRITVEPARQDGAAWKGTLEPGKVADLCILDVDPLEPGRAFADLSVEATVVDGRLVFERGVTPDVDAEPTGPLTR